jgi:hypothetical protein
MEATTPRPTMLATDGPPPCDAKVWRQLPRLDAWMAA